MISNKVDIFCLQLLQNTTHPDRYLRVATCLTSWVISDRKYSSPFSPLGFIHSFIGSGSAGGVCPADPSNASNERLGVAGWRFCDGKEGKEGGIKVKCKTHLKA